MQSPLTWIGGAGPLHSAALLALFLGGVAAGVGALRRLRGGEPPRLLRLTGALGAPLLYAVYAALVIFSLARCVPTEWPPAPT